MCRVTSSQVGQIRPLRFKVQKKDGSSRGDFSLIDKLEQTCAASQAARQLILADLSTKRETHGPPLGVCLVRRYPTRVQVYAQRKLRRQGLRKHGESM